MIIDSHTNPFSFLEQNGSNQLTSQTICKKTRKTLDNKIYDNGKQIGYNKGKRGDYK